MQVGGPQPANEPQQGGRAPGHGRAVRGRRQDQTDLGWNPAQLAHGLGLGLRLYLPASCAQHCACQSRGLFTRIATYNDAIELKPPRLEAHLQIHLHQLFYSLCPNSKDIFSVYLIWRLPNKTLLCECWFQLWEAKEHSRESAGIWDRTYCGVVVLTEAQCLLVENNCNTQIQRLEKQPEDV